MKTTKFKIFVLLIAFAVITACSLDQDKPSCISQYYAVTSAVQGPSTTTINTPITINVGFTIGNSCGVFNRFVEGTGTYPKTIGALVDYNGCQCQEIAQSVTEQYTFTAPAAGTYELRFVTADPNAPIVKTITVTE